MAKNETVSNPLAQLEPQGACDMSLAGSGDFLRRIKLCADLTAEVKDRTAQPGDFFLTGVKNLGAEVEVVVVKARPHALSLIEGSSKVGAESFDLNDEVFKQIKADKDADPQCQEPNNMYGYDFLLWLPAENEFVTIYLCKMALFKSVPYFNRYLGQLAVMTAREERSKKNVKITYRVPVLAMAETQDYNAPKPEDYARATRLFDNPRAQRAGESADQPAPPKGAKPTAKKGGRKGR